MLSYCCKSPAFGDDHVFQDEEIPRVYFKEDDPHLGKLNIINFVAREPSARIS